MARDVLNSGWANKTGTKRGEGGRRGGGVGGREFASASDSFVLLRTVQFLLSISLLLLLSLFQCKGKFNSI